MLIDKLMLTFASDTTWAERRDTLFGTGKASSRRREYRNLLWAFISFYPGGMRDLHRLYPGARNNIDNPEYAETPTVVVAFLQAARIVTDLVGALPPAAKAKALEEFRTADWDAEYRAWWEMVYQAKDGKVPLRGVMPEVRLITFLLLTAYEYQGMDKSAVQSCELLIDCLLRDVRLEDLKPDAPFVTFFDPAKDAALRHALSTKAMADGVPT